MPRCDAGAFWNERGRITYACDQPPSFQVVMNGEDLLALWCTKHMRERAADMLAINPDVRIERWSE